MQVRCVVCMCIGCMCDVCMCVACMCVVDTCVVVCCACVCGMQHAHATCIQHAPATRTYCTRTVMHMRAIRTCNTHMQRTQTCNTHMQDAYATHACITHMHHARARRTCKRVGSSMDECEKRQKLDFQNIEKQVQKAKPKFHFCLQNQGIGRCAASS